MDARLGYVRGTLAAPGSDDQLTFTASAEGINRHGFSLKQNHWLLDNFNNNPVFLWMHNDAMPPIGRGRAVRKSGQLNLSVTFDRSDPFAVEIERKYRAGFMNAVSVGFDFVTESGEPIRDWYRMTSEQIANEAYYDLAEVSAVPIPADPRALIQQRYALAHDFGLFAPESEDVARTVLSGSLHSGTFGFKELGSTITYAAHPLEGRVAELEEKIRVLLSAPPVEPREEQDLQAYDETAVEELLAAIKLMERG